MKFPYGMTDFREIVTGGYFYCDRTDRIPFLEDAKSQLFIRPRRFGKSLLLSMLEHYYDVARKEEFEEIFGGLAIGKNPTALRNSFFVLRWDFSCVDASGSTDEIRQSLYNHLNARIERLVRRYRSAEYPVEGVRLDRDDALASVESLLSATSAAGHPVYLLIDEYDNFANTIMMQGGDNRERYEELVHDQGILKTLFKAIKSSTSSTGFDRVFITGVSPVVLSDITSGYNIAKNIYFNRKLNDLCGFRESEVRDVLEEMTAFCGCDAQLVSQGLQLAKSYYNGYRFCLEKAENVYNPTLCLYFFDHLRDACEFPLEMLDANLAVDETKLEYVAQLPQGAETILTLSERGRDVAVESISKRFGLREMLFEDSQDRSFLLSYLYYFGVLTLSGMDEMGRFLLRVPNLVMQSLYVERARRMLLPDPVIRDEGRDAAALVSQKGDIGPLCTFVQDTLFSVFRNRDYRWANELTLKTAFLTLLYNDILFIMDSEPEVGRRYADLTMIIRPDMRRFKILDVLIEFKFVPLKELGLSGEQIGEMGKDEMVVLPAVEKSFAEGRLQVTTYGGSLDEKYGNLRLQKFVVVALGFERVVWEKVG